MQFYAGDMRQASTSSLTAPGCDLVGGGGGGDAGVQSTGALPLTRQSRVIKIAERLLQDYYTRLSTDPHSMSSLYLDDAEVIYTGKELNVDAVYSCGKAEIEDFFRSEIASKFRCARVVVDALHPQASPTSFFGISLFAKGRLFLNKSSSHQTPPGAPLNSNPPSVAVSQTNNVSSSSFFVPTPYVHFMSLAPPAKPGNWGEIPPLYIANEYFHLLNLNLSPIPRLSFDIPPSSSAILRSSEPPALHSAIMEPNNAVPTVSNAAHVSAVPGLNSLRNESTAGGLTAPPTASSTTNQPPKATDGTTAASTIAAPAHRAASGHRWSQDRVNVRSNTGVSSGHEANTSQRCTVHAQPGFPVTVVDEEIVAAITECIRALGPGSCDSISKPRAQISASGGPSEFPFFFIHCDSPETAHLLLNVKSVQVLGQELRLSPQRTTTSSRMHFGASGSNSWRGGFRSTRANANMNRRHGDSRNDMGGSGESGVSQSPAGGADSNEQLNMSHRPSLQRGSSSARGPHSSWVRRGGFGRNLRGNASSSQNGASSRSAANNPPPSGSSPFSRKSVLVKNEAVAASRVSTSGDAAAAAGGSPRN